MPKGRLGFSASRCMACRAQGHGGITVVEETTPSLSERSIASLIEWHMPKSSALMISKRASAGYPNRLLVSLGCTSLTGLTPFSPRLDSGEPAQLFLQSPLGGLAVALHLLHLTLDGRLSILGAA